MFGELFTSVLQGGERAARAVSDRTGIALPSYRARSDLGWLLLALPKVLAFSLIFILSFLMAIWISFHEYSLLASEQPFVGLDNYAELLLADDVFRISLKNTALYSLGMVGVGVPISLGLAVLLNTGVRYSRVYSACIFLPVVTSWVVVSLIWVWIFNPDSGALNGVLEMAGLPTFQWLQSTQTALASITMMSIWKHVGFNMVIFLAGLQAIPDSYYEAARMDGANRWQQFRNITLPLLKPTTFFVVVVTLIFTFQLFIQVFVMTNGGPVYSTHSIVFYFYQEGFNEFNMGYASAMAVVLFCIVFVLSLLQFKTWGEDVEY